MMVNNYRNIPNILFPLFPECAQSVVFAYNKKLDSVYFPNYLVQRADFVLSNLQNLKQVALASALWDHHRHRHYR